MCSFGTFGLIDAIERWDASAGFQFATYATRRIQGAIIDELRHEDFLPKRLRAHVQVYHATGRGSAVDAQTDAEYPRDRGRAGDRSPRGGLRSGTRRPPSPTSPP